MDDYNIVSLQESTNEWVSRLVNVIRPCVIEGIRAILLEAHTLCQENEEQEKYLMTFQNFLSRIPKWNDEILEKEVERIKDTTACQYLEDLISCVHIIQLKALTCVRVGQKQKAIDIDIPKLNHFIHKVYIQVARKLYSNIYLFEMGIAPLQIQKNNREIELIVNDCILEAVRESIPVDSILKAYLDETIEENVETVMTESKEINASNNPENDSKNIKEETTINTSTEPMSKSMESQVKEITTEPGNITLTTSFSDVDEHQSANKVIKNVVAPKDIDTLERISEENNERRKMEELEYDDEDDDEKITIHDDKENNEIKLDFKTL